MRRLLTILIITVLCTKLSAQHWVIENVDNEKCHYLKDSTNQYQETMLCYHKNSNIISKITKYMDGYKNGDELLFDTNGTLLSLTPFSKGKIHGINKTFHHNGKIEWTRPYKNGKMFGQRILKNSNGEKVNGLYTTRSVKYLYTTNNKEGIPFGHFEMIDLVDSSITMKGQFTNGYPDGTFEYYDKNEDTTTTYSLNYNWKEQAIELGKIPDTLNLITTNLKIALNEINNSNTHQAIRTLEYVLTLDSNNIDALYNLGVLLSESKKYWMAHFHFKKCLQLDKSNFRAAYNLGFAYFQLKYYEKSLLYFSNCININPKYIDAYYNRAKVFEKLGEKEKYKTDIRKYKKLKKA